jgi:UDP-N-acetylglucosamine acyltransferase
MVRLSTETTKRVLDRGPGQRYPFVSFGAQPVTIHPLAYVDPLAHVAEDASVGPFAVVGAGVTLGAGVELMPHAVVLGPTELGPGCRVFPHAVLGGEPQDLKYRGAPTTLVVGRDNTFREGCTVHRGTLVECGGRGRTVLGDDNLLMAQSHVAHDVIMGDGCVLANSAALAGHAEIGNSSILGGLVGIHQRARIGRLAMVGAGSMVSQDVPPFCMAQGDRARLVGLNLIGLRRAAFDHELISLLKRAWQLLAERNQTRAVALEQMLALGPASPEICELVDFVRASRRGLCRPGRADNGATGGA